mgnify:CR=1 FL=1
MTLHPNFDLDIFLLSTASHITISHRMKMNMIKKYEKFKKKPKIKILKRKKKRSHKNRK